MSMTRKIILALFFIGFAGNVGGGGTFASFSASTTNPSSTFASGSLVLSNTTPAQSACLSTGGGTNTDTNANGTCGVVFNVSLAKPGQTATVDVTIENVGTLDGTLKLYSNTGACSSGTTGTYSGSGNLCTQLQMTVQRYTSAANRTSGTTTGGTCVYSSNFANPCVLNSAATPNHFSTTYTNATNGLSLGTLAAANGGDTDAAFLRFTILFPDSGAGADNAFQGRTAGFGFTWFLEQT